MRSILAPWSLRELAQQRVSDFTNLSGEILTDGRSSRALPIVVDLDNTLILGDSFHEQLAAGLLANPLGVFRAALHVFEGPAALKAAIAQEVDPALLKAPLREDLLAWLHGEATKGREIHLCSAANQTSVDNVASDIGLFATAVGSRDINLKGHEKAEYLQKSFPNGFVYAGDSRSDLAVWTAAQGVVLAGASASVARAARRLGKPIEAEFRTPPMTARDWLKALRVHHWSKNALIFLPLVLAHAWSNPLVVVSTSLGLLCLLLMTSATYLLNDITDLASDRLHWSKRKRALASGRLSIRAGFEIAASAMVLSLTGAFVLSFDFALVLTAYLVLTLAYSFGLKRIPLLDALIIGMLFTSRLVMGIALLNQFYSEWLLAFSTFFFVSLALAKRHTEIVRATDNGSHGLTSRGYQIEDGPLTLVFGVSTSVASLVIAVLFIVEELFERHQYSHPKILWGILVALTIWVGRIWLLAHRGRMTDDPVSFALRDWVSLLLGAGVAVFFVIAL